MNKVLAKQILLALSLVALSGCVTYPIAKDLQQQARRVTLAQVREDPGAYQGTVVIWGGRIISATNDVNSSAIYVLCLPLDGAGKPVLEAGSPGRFIASSKEFLDPEIYTSGRFITVAGSIAGLESQPVQNGKYNYPVLDIKQIHLWPAEPRYRYYYYEPGWGWYYYPYPGWDWWWYPGWGARWGWYYGGNWDWDRDRAYHYHGGGWDRGGGWNRGGSYHYQGGGGGSGGGGTGHWHR